MLQYKIPQNIGIEDKIVGPLTLRQLIILAVGGGISYVLFATLSKLYELNIIEYTIIALPALLAVAAALLKINDIPLTKFALLTAEFSIKPKKRYWDHRAIVPIINPDLTEKKRKLVKQDDINVQGKKKSVNLSKLSNILDSGGFNHVETVAHADIDKVEDEDLVTQAFLGHKKETDNMHWRTKNSHKKHLEMLEKLPRIQPKNKEDLNINKISSQKTQEIANKPDQIKKEKSAPQVQIKKKVDPKVPAVSKTSSIKDKKGNIQHNHKTQIKNQNSRQKQIDVQDFKKKRRPRNRKIAHPLRPHLQVNNTVKKQPKYHLPSKPKPQPLATEKSKITASSGEFELKELQRGEIKIDLD